MLLNWIMLAIALHKDSRRQRKDPLADPLDAPEWDGLRWALPFLSWMAQRPHKADWLRGELAEARSGSGRGWSHVSARRRPLPAPPPAVPVPQRR
ncbi:hypothetical protein FHT78_000326 [Rhizobium sp. BK196]|nr:hypothetical protein [Rhizobium sp. BK196]